MFKRRKEIQPLGNDVRNKQHWEYWDKEPKLTATRRGLLRLVLPAILHVYLPAMIFRWRAEVACLVCGGLTYNANRHFFLGAPGELVEKWMVGRERSGVGVRMVVDDDGAMRRVVEGDVPSPSPTLRQWRHSAQQGCYTCRIVMAGIAAIHPQWLEGEEEEGKHVDAVSPPVEFFQADMPVQVLLVDVNRKAIDERLKRLTIFQKFKDPKAYMRGMLGIDGVVGRTNVEALLMVRKWLWVCDEAHESCRGGAVGGTPLRLIDVGDPAATGLESLLKKCATTGRTSKGRAAFSVQHCLDVLSEVDVGCRLVEGHDDKDASDGRRQYIALSYCWGTASDKWLMTTADTLASFRKQIPWKTAPKTLRDAILLTRFLGVRYLWIDALCIIQNDRDEWLKEGTRMADIYAGAWLVVAASTAADCTEGFFGEQVFGDETWQASFPAPKAPKHLFSTACSTLFRRGGRKTLYARTGTMGHRHVVFDNDALMMGRRRGWTFQERLFARRILHVSRFEMLWRCAAWTLCECSLVPWPRTKLLGLDMAAPFEEVHRIREAALPGMSAEQLSMSWMALVRFYSRTQVTHEDDRLVAISSLSRYIGQECLGVDGADYLAGLWRHDLVRQLCWTTALPPAVDSSYHADYGPPPLSPPSIPPRTHVAALPRRVGTEPNPARGTLEETEEDRLPLRQVNSMPQIRHDTLRFTGTPGAGGSGGGGGGGGGGHHVGSRTTSYKLGGGRLWNTSRPAVYRAPSWSWASVQIPVHFRSVPQPGHLDEARNDWFEFHSCITIRAAETVTLAGLPFGPVSSAFILLEGAVTRVSLRVLPDPADSMSKAAVQVVSQFVLKTGSGHVFLAQGDVAMEPAVPLPPESWACLARSMAGGTRCRAGPQCGCLDGFLAPADDGEFYALRVGYSRDKHGTWHPSVWVMEMYMILRKVRPGDHEHHGSAANGEAYERIGLGFSSYRGSDPANFRLFQDAKVKTIRLL